MSASRVARPKKRKVRRYGADAPLRLAARAPVDEARPAGLRARLSGPVLAGVRALPALPTGAAAARMDRVWKIGLGLAGLLLVTQARDGAWGWAALGVALGASTLWLPLTDIRRIRWTRWAQGLAASRVATALRPAEVLWDGHKLVVRAGERVWRSLRPASPPHEVRCGADAGRAWLGLVPPGGARSRSIWFAAPATALASEPLSESPADAPVEVDAAAFEALFEAFVCRLDRLPKAPD